MELLNVGPADYARVVELNESATPQVPTTSERVLRALFPYAFYFRAAHADGEVVGFLLALAETAHYDRPSFLWFMGRYSSFAYIDRVVVAKGWRRRGIGRSLYRDLAAHAARHGVPMGCEVNVLPPHPVLMDFHLAQGFVEVGRQDLDGGRTRVALLVIGRGEPGLS